MIFYRYADPLKNITFLFKVSVEKCFPLLSDEKSKILQEKLNSFLMQMLTIKGNV